ncbi:MAG: MerR family transcriptional regulator [Deltaproteobacteria bacterium]|nr:MerR family transcriptional regulator [Deltaproteobacteria bacterium]
MKEALTATIPNKLYFRIGEVADLLAVKPYVLRYWETEFPDIKPSKSKSGQRLYKRRDVETLVRIKDLLYRDRFTINGARKKLRELIREQRGTDEVTEEIGSSNGHPAVPVQADLAPVPVVAFHEPKPELKKAPLPQTAQPALDQRKVLHKIKKDMETLLSLLKA